MNGNQKPFTFDRLPIRPWSATKCAPQTLTKGIRCIIAHLKDRPTPVPSTTVYAIATFVDRAAKRGGFARSDSFLRSLSGTSEAIMLPI